MTDGVVLGIVATVVGALVIAFVTGVTAFAVNRTLEQYVKREEFIKLQMRFEALKELIKDRI